MLIIVGEMAIGQLGLAGNSTPSADEQHAVFVEVGNEVQQYAKYFRVVGRQYDSVTTAYIFACQSLDPGKAEWLVFVPIELANNADAVCALFNQAAADDAFWKEALADKSADH